MPLLDRERDIYPDDLLDCPSVGSDPDKKWWAMYTMARREKELMRRLRPLDVSFYTPIIVRRSRSAGSGRVRTSYVPLFTGYVFIYGDADSRQRALATNCISRWLDVPDGPRLTFDLRQIRRLISVDAPLTAEERLTPGSRVRVKTGAFAGLEGVVVRRAKESHLIIQVDFLQRGASVVLDDCQLEAA
jgi:transcriptional antiterminator RfaH